MPEENILTNQPSSKINISEIPKRKTEVKKILLSILISILVIVGIAEGIWYFRNKLYETIELQTNDINEEQITAIQRLADASEEGINYYSKGEVIRNLEFKMSVEDYEDKTEEEIFWEFMTEYSDVFQLDPDQIEIKETLELDSQIKSTNIVFTQKYNGIDVYSSDCRMIITKGNPTDFWYSGGYTPNLEIDTIPKISEEQALRRIFQRSSNVVDDIKLEIYETSALGFKLTNGSRLCWYIPTKMFDYWVDASNGLQIQKISNIIYEDWGN